MHKTLAEVAEYLGGDIVGDAGTIITGVCGIKEAEPGDITFVANHNGFLPLFGNPS